MPKNATITGVNITVKRIRNLCVKKNRKYDNRL